MNKIIKCILSLTPRGKMIVKINTLENENESLKNMVKNELYTDLIKKLSEPHEIARLESEIMQVKNNARIQIENLQLENKKLRNEIKILKEKL